MKQRKLPWVLLAILLIPAFFALWVASRPNMAEVGIPYADTATGNSGLQVKWLGVTTLLFDDDETQIMTDGFISRPSLLDILLERAIAPDIGAIRQVIETHQINRLAAIMPVHSHYDHAMDTADFARLTGADLLGSATTANIALASDVDPIKLRIITPGVQYTYGKFTITFYESKHAPLASNSGIEGVVENPLKLPAPYTAWKEGKSFSIHIAHPEGTALVQGSAGFIPGVLEDLQADTVFLGSGGLMGLPEDYVTDYTNEIVHTVNPTSVFIVHHDNLFGEFGDVEQSKLLLSFDKTFAHKLTQWVLPARLQQLSFGKPVPVKAASNQQVSVGL